jgi:hypothetical protein
MSRQARNGWWVSLNFRLAVKIQTDPLPHNGQMMEPALISRFCRLVHSWRSAIEGSSLDARRAGR